MNSDQILEQFKNSDALLDGHFILSSGLHSPKYLQCALALQYPNDAAEFARAIAGKLAAEQFDTVASPAIGGFDNRLRNGKSVKCAFYLDGTAGRRDDFAARFFG